MFHKMHNNMSPYAYKIRYKLCTKSYIFTLKKPKNFTPCPPSTPSPSRASALGLGRFAPSQKSCPGQTPPPAQNPGHAPAT